MICGMRLAFCLSAFLSYLVVFMKLVLYSEVTQKLQSFQSGNSRRMILNALHIGCTIDKESTFIKICLNDINESDA